MTQKTNVSQDMIINIVERAVTEVTVQAFLIQHALTVNCAVPALCEIGNILRTVPTNSEAPLNLVILSEQIPLVCAFIVIDTLRDAQ